MGLRFLLLIRFWFHQEDPRQLIMFPFYQENPPPHRIRSYKKSLYFIMKLPVYKQRRGHTADHKDREHLDAPPAIGSDISDTKGDPAKGKNTVSAKYSCGFPNS